MSFLNCFDLLFLNQNIVLKLLQRFSGESKEDEGCFLPYFSRDKIDAEDEEKNENEKNNVVAPKKQPLSLEEMIARRDAEKKAQEKVLLK